ncbi:MAG: heme o synthase [Endozoicomonadaceae bacterium]|nr:heme o synthase [Endozoicomonadaceae bacterium]MCY4328571.1 heme o synthase [Endozoicomonadaceae bacterium]
MSTCRCKTKTFPCATARPRCLRTKILNFISITKPGIVAGNLITAIAGFFFGAKGILYPLSLFSMMAGTIFIIASACVFNNFIDQDIDRLMPRTAYRTSLFESLSKYSILSYATILLISGSSILYFFTGILPLLVALAGFIVYLLFYTLWLKRRSTWSTLIGSISGATPPVIGYCAATHRFDDTAILLCLLLITWQMPHFLAISLYRLRDYNAAFIPVLPELRGKLYTQIHMLCWILLFVICIALLAIKGNIHWFYFSLVLVSSLSWFVYGCATLLQKMLFYKWGKQMFLISLINIFLASIMLCLSV